jgi:hypothetical protein
VLAQGVPVEIQVIGTSMEPTLRQGTRLTVAAVEGRMEAHVGDVVVIATDDPAELVVHRLMHLFCEGDRRLVIHQGDATGAAFAVTTRDRIIARVTGVAGPTPHRPISLEPSDARRFRRRRIACRAYAAARRVAIVTGLRRSPLLRRCGEVMRRLAECLTN